MSFSFSSMTLFLDISEFVSTYLLFCLQVWNSFSLLIILNVKSSAFSKYVSLTVTQFIYSCVPLTSTSQHVE